MRRRLIATNFVAVSVAAAVVVGCSNGSNVDLVLTAGDVAAGSTLPTANQPVATNPGGVAIDRSSVPATGAGASAGTAPAGGDPANPPSSGGTAAPGGATPTPANPANPSVTDPSRGGAPQPSLAPSSQIPFLFSSVADFAAAWNKSRSAISGSPFAALDANSIQLKTMSLGGQGFAVKSAVPNGVLGGTVENSGAVSSVMVIIPGDTDTAKAVQTVWAMLDSTGEQVPIFDGMKQYSEFTQNGIPAEGTQMSVDPSGTHYTVVFTVVPGSVIGSATNAIEVAIIPFADQAGALGMVQPLRVEILRLLN